MSLSTDDPLMFHFTDEPLLEEYSIAAVSVPRFFPGFDYWIDASDVVACACTHTMLMISGIALMQWNAVRLLKAWHLLPTSLQSILLEGAAVPLFLIGKIWHPIVCAHPWVFACLCMQIAFVLRAALVSSVHCRKS